jgi:hypothetical protein
MSGTTRGARSAFDDDGRKKRGFPWWLLALLAIALIAIVLLARSCGDDEESGDRGAATTPTTQEQPEAAPSGAAGGEAGTLTAGGQSLLGGGAGASLEQYVEQPAEGQRVRVQEVIPEEGFFVGTSEEDRVYVEFGGDVGETEQNSNSYNAKVGDEVNLTGPVRPAPAEPEQTLNLDAEDAAQVKKQGAFINAEMVEKAS